MFGVVVFLNADLKSESDCASFVEDRRCGFPFTTKVLLFVNGFSGESLVVRWFLLFVFLTLM